MKPRSRVFINVMAWLGCGWLLAAVLAASNSPNTLEEFAFQRILSYEFGQSIEPLNLIVDHVHDAAGNPERCRELEQRLIAVLQAQATPAAKDFACRQLALIGTDTAAPALAALLTEHELSHMARYALDRIPTEAASKALRDGMDEAKGELLVGLIDSVGERHDQKAIKALIKHFGNSNHHIARAVAKALGKIGGAEAAQALVEALPGAAPSLRPAISDACLLCADQFLAQGKSDQSVTLYQALWAQDNPKAVRLAALQGLATVQREKALPLVFALLNDSDPHMQSMAGHFVRVMEGTAVTLMVVAQMPKLTPLAQVIVLTALADRGDTAALPAVTEAVDSKNDGIRLAAIKALASLGNASTVLVLAQAAATGKEAERDQARWALARLCGSNIDDTIASARAEADDLKVRVELIRALAVRSAASAVLSNCLKLFKEELEAAISHEDKQRVLEGLASVRTVDSLKLVAAFLDDETVQAVAAESAVKIAGPQSASPLDSKDDGLSGEEVAAVLKKVVKVAKDPDIRNRALIDIRRKLSAANLAQGKPIKASCPPKAPWGVPELAVDGNTSRESSWHGVTSPAWLEVDLLKSAEIDSVHVFPYWDGRSIWDDRYYQYTIEVSLDEEEWKQIVDMSKNTQPATSEGVMIEFKPVQVRYVRINIIKDSADQELRLVELKVYAAIQ